MKNKKNIVLENLRPISGGDAFCISSKRNNATQTFSVTFYKPISKFKIL